MAKSTYIGVDGVARKVKKLYIGVDGVARKVKKAYIGVDGVARLCYQSGRDPYGVTALEFTVTQSYTEDATNEFYKDDELYVYLDKKDTSPTHIYINGALVATSTTSGDQSVKIATLEVAKRAEILAMQYILTIDSDGDYAVHGLAAPLGGMAGNGKQRDFLYALKGSEWSQYASTSGWGVSISYAELDNHVTAIGDYGLGTVPMDTFVVPSSVTSIGEKGMACIKDITIPRSVASIGDYAFGSLNGYAIIRTITFEHLPSDALTLGANIFKSKSAYELTVNHYGHSAVTGYDYATDNATVTLNQLG